MSTATRDGRRVDDSGSENPQALLMTRVSGNEGAATPSLNFIFWNPPKICDGGRVGEVSRGSHYRKSVSDANANAAASTSLKVQPNIRHARSSTPSRLVPRDSVGPERSVTSVSARARTSAPVRPRRGLSFFSTRPQNSPSFHTIPRIPSTALNSPVRPRPRRALSIFSVHTPNPPSLHTIPRIPSSSLAFNSQEEEARARHAKKQELNTLQVRAETERIEEQIAELASTNENMRRMSCSAAVPVPELGETLTRLQVVRAETEEKVRTLEKRRDEATKDELADIVTVLSQIRDIIEGNLNWCKATLNSGMEDVQKEMKKALSLREDHGRDLTANLTAESRAKEKQNEEYLQEQTEEIHTSTEASSKELVFFPSMEKEQASSKSGLEYFQSKQTHLKHLLD